MRLFTTLAFFLVPLALLGQEAILVNEAKAVISATSDRNGGYYYLGRQDLINTAIFKRDSSASITPLVRNTNIEIAPLTLHSQNEWLAGDTNVLYFPVYDPKTFTSRTPKFAHLAKYEGGKIKAVLKIGDEINYLALDGSNQKEYFFHAYSLGIGASGRITLVAFTSKKPFGINSDLITHIFELSNNKLTAMIIPYDRTLVERLVVERGSLGETTKNNFWYYEGFRNVKTELVYRTGSDRLIKLILSNIEMMDVANEGGLRTNENSVAISYRNPRTGEFRFSRFRDDSDVEENLLHGKTIDGYPITTSRGHAYSNDGSLYFVMNAGNNDGVFRIKDGEGKLIKLPYAELDGQIEQIIESAGRIYLLVKSNFSGKSVYAILRPEYGPSIVSGMPGDLSTACSDCISPGLSVRLTVNGSSIDLGIVGDKLRYYIPNFPVGVHDAYLQLGNQLRKFTLEILAKPSDNTPTIDSLVNAASFKNSISPCSLATIFGKNLSSITTRAVSLPLPRQLGGTVVTFDGTPAPIWFVSPSQVNIQVPCELGVPANISIQIITAIAKSRPLEVTVTSKSPGIFNYEGRPLTSRADFSPVEFTKGESVAPGQYYIFWLTGGGPTDPAAMTGEASPLANAIETPRLTLDGIEAEITYFGLAPGLVGVYQLVVLIPDLKSIENKPIEVSGLLSFEDSNYNQTFKILYK